MRTTVTTLACLLLCTIFFGCSTVPAEPPQTARLTFAADRYPAVFEAAVQTLRDHGYRIARRDYRFGTITTFSKEAATTAEFWIDDATTRQQRKADTLNSQQRTVTIKVEQPAEQPGYTLTIEVLVQRLQRPERYLTHSASPRISSTYTDVPAHLKNRGIDGPYAQTMDRDPLLERRLIEAIKSAVSAPDESSDSNTDNKQSKLNTQIRISIVLLEPVSQGPLADRQRNEISELITTRSF